jgi:hypothetical protein
MTEHNTGHDAELEERIAQLTTGGFGASRREAELILQDDDLWLVHDQMRSPFEGEKAVQEWKEARDIARHFLSFAIDTFDNRALLQLACDAEGRAEEALRRAQKRAREEAS